MRLVGLALLVAALAAPTGPVAGEPAPGFTVEQARSAVAEHVQRTVQEGGGVYRLRDDQAGRTHELEFVHVGVVSAGNLWTTHDPNRRVEGPSFFACTVFHPVGAPKEKVLDIDMLVEPRDGRLAVTEVRIHMEKQLVGGEWIWQPRRKGAGGGANR